jgi:hypothetical protein
VISWFQAFAFKLNL